MPKIIVRGSLFLLSGLAFTLFSPALLEASCSVQCAKAWCESPDGMCCCDAQGWAWCGSVEDACSNAQRFDATSAELDAFKDQIDQWYVAGSPELMALGDAASVLYTAVLIQDAEGYLKANSEYRKLLTASARKPSDQEAWQKPRK